MHYPTVLADILFRFYGKGTEMGRFVNGECHQGPQGSSQTGKVLANKKLIAERVPANKMFFAETVPAKNFKTSLKKPDTF